MAAAFERGVEFGEVDPFIRSSHELIFGNAACRGILVLLVLTLSIPQISWAQRGRGQQVGLARQGFVPVMETVYGKIAEIKIGPCEMTTGRALSGAHLIVQQTEDQTINLHLGPEEDVKYVTERLSAGKVIQAAVFRTPLLPAEHYVVQSITIEDQTFILREETLRPVWAGRSFSWRPILSGSDTGLYTAGKTQSGTQDYIRLTQNKFRTIATMPPRLGPGKNRQINTRFGRGFGRGRCLRLGNGNGKRWRGG